jgi:hypothetical protein
MARSRRSYRKSTSQQAVSLFASTLPRPLQYVAHTQLGSQLLLFGIPALLVAGVLQLNWDGGLPQFTVDQQRAVELRNVARDELGRISDPAMIQHLERSATNIWNATQGQNYVSSPSPYYSNGANYPSTPNPSTNGYGYPSSSAAYPQSNFNNYPQTQPNYSYPQVPQVNYPNSQPGYTQLPQPTPYAYQQPQPYQSFQPQSQLQSQNPWRR